MSLVVFPFSLSLYMQIRRTVFFDSRKHFGPQIVIISMHHDAIKEEKLNLYARIPPTSSESYNKDSGFHCLKVSKWKQVGWVREDILPPETYVAYLLRIKDSVALSEVPPYIELTTDKECRKDMLPKMPVFYDRRPREGVFAVCTQKGLFGRVTQEQVINWVEINRAMGAAIITIQIQYDQLGDDIKQVLLPYIKEGFVELIDWKIAVTTRDYGMSAGANECIYRNVNRAQFVTVHDVDELLVPQQHKDWSEMITYLHKIINVDKYASFSFRNTHWYYNSEEGSLTGRLCKGVEAPVYFNWTLRTRHPTLESPKIMANLDNAIAAFCHTLWRWRKGTRKVYYISPSLGLSHHYRTPYKGMGSLQSSVMDKYVSTVIPRLNKTYNMLYLC